MPPKDAIKKGAPSVYRLPVTESSFLYIPKDAVEGYQDRFETDIEWTLTEETARHHKKLCLRQKIPEVPFSEALKNKLQSSLVGGFLDDESTMTIQEQYEFVVASAIWDNEKFGNDEAKACFLNDNCFTDDIVKLIKKAVKFNSREILKKEIRLVNLLRVNHSQMTHLDSELQKFTKLITFNCCDNFIEYLDAKLLPPVLRSLELQSNAIKSVEDFVEYLPPHLFYLGLGRNLLKNDAVESLSRLPHNITVLDLANNDIYDLQKVLDALVLLPNLTSLILSGNPCALCAAYAYTTLAQLQRLKWLDYRQVLPTDRPEREPLEPHPNDLLSTYFYFTVFRVMSLPQPPKPEKGAVVSFHIELELPLLDTKRRAFLMFRRNESLTEMLPPPEDDWHSVKTSSEKIAVMEEGSSHASDVYKNLEPKNSRIIYNYTIYESNKIQWSPVMNFQEPVVKIFCPDLVALRDTFRTVITVRLIYTQIMSTKPLKGDKKSATGLKLPSSEQRLTLATIKCHLRTPDWTQPSQHFHWDDSLGTHDAIHWGDGDLSILQYTQVPAKPVKGKADTDTGTSRQMPPENFTCHFGFGIDTQRA